MNKYEKPVVSFYSMYINMLMRYLHRIAKCFNPTSHYLHFLSKNEFLGTKHIREYPLCTE